MLEYIRIGCAVPQVAVGDPKENTAQICDFLRRAEEQGCDLVVFPELATTGYSCADLFFQEALLHGGREALREITAYTAKFAKLTVFLGLPCAFAGQLYNCCAVIAGGKVLGVVPKTFLPNYGEFYERRWFHSGLDLPLAEVDSRELGLTEGYSVPVGGDLIFQTRGANVGVEICEDLWSPLPPSTMLALQGAEVIVNLSASNEIIGKRDYRRELVRHQSAATSTIYAYASAGSTESTQDLIFSGHCLVGENGTILAETPNGIGTNRLLVADADLGKVRADRRKTNSFREAASVYAGVARQIFVDGEEARSDGSRYAVNKLPFVPARREERESRCMEIFDMQVEGLRQRLVLLGSKTVVGVSGGLDSTLALLTAVEAMHRLGRPAGDVHAITMPCFGTTDRTYSNSLALMKALGVTTREVNIREAVLLHFRDIGHDPAVLNATYENAQARERTQILMDYAGEVGGIVVGTGDLSELALGWCTYNGDHMSMYGVNASIPKTLIRWMIEAISEMAEFAPAHSVLMDILDTPISPELLPPDAQGRIAQQTEDIVGPYALHDFFLYYMLRFGFTPKKIFTLACRAFREDFDQDAVKKWLKVFYRRFFAQQFKRNCQPDGVKVGSVALGPRGDWRMPSDASARLWLEEVETL
ncbi:MAG TPA: NAD(+) synthase [Candidatus Faecousia intestinigallinarum]|nr:NAD(+) synthase [Candidatus Faecousia intestinigallinarum]